MGNGSPVNLFIDYRIFSRLSSSFFFFNDTATTEIYTLSLHDALPISFVEGLNTLSAASHNEVSFFSRKKYLKDLEKTKACAVIIGEEHKGLAPCQTLVGGDAYLLYANATHIFRELNAEPVAMGFQNWLTFLLQQKLAHLQQ